MFFSCFRDIDVDTKLDFVLKNIPNGGLIELDNLSLDKNLKQIKFYRLQAILHDAAGYLQEKIKPDLVTQKFDLVQ